VPGLYTNEGLQLDDDSDTCCSSCNMETKVAAYELWVAQFKLCQDDFERGKLRGLYTDEEFQVNRICYSLFLRTFVGSLFLVFPSLFLGARYCRMSGPFRSEGLHLSISPRNCSG
jgi:hypothetical protein